MPSVRLTPALRVLAIPSAHPYSERLRSTSPDASRVVHLDDPAVPGAPAVQWWPPTALDAEWVRRHAGEVDVVHLHFGFDAASPADLSRWVRALREAGQVGALVGEVRVDEVVEREDEGDARLTQRVHPPAEV